MANGCLAMSNVQRVQYSSQKILNGLDVLAHKIAKIGLSAEIISPLFNGKINGKIFSTNRETIPLVIILEDAIRYIYGRLGRCYFDAQGKNNNTASINVLFDQIFNNNNEDKKTIYKKEYDEINNKLNDAIKYKSKLKKFCNKHYAHTDIKPLVSVEADFVKLNIPWDELVGLVNDAKNIINNMYSACQKSPFDFSDSVYDEYRKQFWRLIDFPEVKVTTHLLQKNDNN